MTAIKAATAAERTLRLERRFAAAPARVYRAFTDPAELKRWWGPEGFTTPEAKLDVRVGGAYALTMKAPDGALYYLSGAFRVVDPPKRLVYTWTWKEGGYGGVPTLVTLDFKADGKGTLLRLTHEAMTSEEMLGDHKDGWTSALDKLERLCKGEAA